MPRGIRAREAILQALLNDPACSDDRALAIAGGGRKADVGWRRRGIYAVIRLREENATAWDVPARYLKAKVEDEGISKITAVIWAVMKHFDQDDEVAMRQAGLAGFRQWRDDGYAPMARAIWEKVATLDGARQMAWRDLLARQMARTVGKRSLAWIRELEQQVDVLRGLSDREAPRPPDVAGGGPASQPKTAPPRKGGPSQRPASPEGQMPRASGTAPLPNDRLLSVMLDAYQPCANFGRCIEARWVPERGHVPRGFLGATGTPADVEVVMVFSEPGRPLVGEGHDSAFAPLGLLRSAMQHTYNCYKSDIDQFHRNVRWFLSQLWPNLTFDEQLGRVWLTEGRLCSINDEIGSTTDRTCAEHYLVQQMRALPQATVVAFGRKAQRYLHGIGIDFVSAFALSPPGANFGGARPSWEAAIERIRARRSAR